MISTKWRTLLLERSNMREKEISDHLREGSKDDELFAYIFLPTTAQALRTVQLLLEKLLWATCSKLFILLLWATVVSYPYFCCGLLL